MRTSEPIVIFAIDPGRNKIGVAILDSSGECQARDVIPKDKFAGVASEYILQYRPNVIAIGNGTGSDWVFGVMSAFDIHVIRVIEIGSTLEARDLAWRENPPGGIFRILPKIFWPIPPDIDSWAAVVIGRRVTDIFKTVQGQKAVWDISEVP